MSAYYNDSEPYAAEWTRNLIARGLIAPGVVDGRSIKEVVAADVRGATQAHFFSGIGVWSYALRLAQFPDELEGRRIWTGSCPCQPFSAAGRKRGANDERHLWPEWFRLIRECRPDGIFGEQVASADGLKWLDLVSADLEGEGYTFGAADLCAAGVGAPHLRQRLYFVAYSAESGWKPRWGSSVESNGRATPWLEPRRLREARALANAEGGRLERGQCVPKGSTWQHHADDERRGSFDGVADADGGRRGSFFWNLRAGQSHDGGSSAAFGVADTNGGTRDEGRSFATGCDRRGNESTRAGFGGGGVACELADTDGESRRLHVQPGQSRRAFFEALGRGEARGLGNANQYGGRWQSRAPVGTNGGSAAARLQPRPERDATFASGAVGFVGDASSAGLPLELGEPGVPCGEGDGDAGEAAFGAGSPTRGFWANAQWLYCLDKKWRPTEPGVEPLAHGTSGRVAVVRTIEQGGSAFPTTETHWYSRIGSIKGYGNAIVGPLAATFIRAFMDVVGL